MCVVCVCDWVKLSMMQQYDVKARPFAFNAASKHLVQQRTDIAQSYAELHWYSATHGQAASMCSVAGQFILEKTNFENINCDRVENINWTRVWVHVLLLIAILLIHSDSLC